MKQFIIKDIFIGTCVILLLAALYLLIPVKPNHYLRAYKQKCELLETVPSPRIIFVGGSNLAFGLDSKRIQDSLHVNVINYGLHAGMGLKFMLDDVASYVRKGDIVVFAPEWTEFYVNMYGEGEVPAFIPRIGGWEKLQLFNRQQIISFVKAVPSYIEQNLSPQIITPKTYSSSNFNQYGDEVKHWTLENKYRSHPGPMKAEFNHPFGQYFITKLKKLQQQCSVYMLPPAFCETLLTAYQPQIKEVSLFLAKEGFPFLTSPEKFAFSEDDMYDTDYHLNKEGVDKRTDLMIKVLKPYVKSIN